MNKIVSFLLSIALVIGLTACSDNNKSKTTVKVGTIAGPETQLMQTAQEVAKQRYGLNVKVVTFSDYDMPNAALSDGNIDVNVFQHAPFLHKQMKEHNYKFAVIGKTFIYPMGIYSKKVKSLADVQDGAKVAIPSDPSNEARALLLLQQAKLIQLKPKSGQNATPADIASNPYHLVFSELDSADLPRALGDVDFVVINTNFAIPAGLSPTKDALLHENANSPYANVIVVRAQDKNDPRFQQLVLALHSAKVLAQAKKLFGEGAIPAFTVAPAATGKVKNVPGGGVAAKAAVESAAVNSTLAPATPAATTPAASATTPAAATSATTAAPATVKVAPTAGKPAANAPTSKPAATPATNNSGKNQ